MAGVLSFALGLQSTQFAGAIDAVSGRLAAFIGVTQTLKSVWNAIEFGGGLTDLSNETGVAEGQLFQLQEALEQVGSSAQSLPGLLNRMQISLAGVDEAGMDTSDMLSQMGLNMDDLNGMSAVDQIVAIAEALDSLSQEQARYASQRIFGREGGSAGLRIARDLDAFKESLSNTQSAGNQIGKTAAQFDRIGDSVIMIKGQLKGFWAGVAEGSAPAIEAAIEWSNSFDFVSAGKQVGLFFKGITQIFKEGNFSDLISEGLYAGFAAGISMVWPLLQKLGNAFFMLLGSVGVSFVSSIQWGILRLQQAKGGDKAPTFGQVWDANMGKVVAAYKGMSEETDRDLKAGISKSFQNFGQVWDKISAAAGRLEGDLVSAKKEGEEKEKRTISMNTEERASRALPGPLEVTDFEKFGFTFGSGGPTPIIDLNRQIANNSRQTNMLLKEIKAGISRLNLGGGAIPLQ